MTDGGLARSIGNALAGLAALVVALVALFLLFVGAFCDPSTATCVSGTDYLAGTRTDRAGLQLVAGVGLLALAGVAFRGASTGHFPAVLGATVALAAFVVATRATIGALGLVPLGLLVVAVAALAVDRRRGTGDAEGARD